MERQAVRMRELIRQIAIGHNLNIFRKSGTRYPLISFIRY
jgi:hypothetical protein